MLFEHGHEVTVNTAVVYQKKLLQDEQEHIERKKVKDSPWFKLVYVVHIRVQPR